METKHAPDFWERRGASVYTEGDGTPGNARLIVEIHGMPNAIEAAQAIVDAHNKDAGPDLLAALENFRGWHADHFGDFTSEINAELLCLDNDAAYAIAKATGGALPEYERAARQAGFTPLENGMWGRVEEDGMTEFDDAKAVCLALGLEP